MDSLIPMHVRKELTRPMPRSVLVTEIWWHTRRHGGIQRLLKVVEAVLCFGARKYKPYGWRDVPNQKFRDAYVRHMHATDEYDRESGMPHSWHAACNLVILLAKKLEGQ